MSIIMEGPGDRILRQRREQKEKNVLISIAVAVTVVASCTVGYFAYQAALDRNTRECIEISLRVGGMLSCDNVGVFR